MQAAPSSLREGLEGAAVGGVDRPAARAGSGASPCKARPIHTIATCEIEAALVNFCSLQAPVTWTVMWFKSHGISSLRIHAVSMPCCINALNSVQARFDSRERLRSPVSTEHKDNDCNRQLLQP